MGGARGEGPVGRAGEEGAVQGFLMKLGRGGLRCKETARRGGGSSTGTTGAEGRGKGQQVYDFTHQLMFPHVLCLLLCAAGVFHLFSYV